MAASNMRKEINQAKDGERGVALLELAISLPVLVLLFLGLVDVSNMLINYMSMSQVADEAVRTLSAVPSLKATASDVTSFDTATIAACTTNPASNNLCGHLLAHRRVQYLAELLRLQNVDSAALQIKTRYQGGIASAAATENDTVRVEITATFNGIFFFLNNFPISVRAQGPYLFEPAA